MGFDSNGVRFMLDMKRNGIDLGRCAILGRQEMHVTKHQLMSAFKTANMSITDHIAEDILNNNGDTGYAESFLKYCGAKEIVSIDNSGYECATLIHDMNKPIPKEHEGQFDCVIDSGTLEHIFNAPIAISNCMKMVKLNGHILIINVCNNFMGHGFYQFSPELFYGVLSEKNGYKIDKMLIFESRVNAQWYMVSNPKDVKSRVELINSMPTYLLIQARRIQLCDLTNITPQQSDYVTRWNDNATHRIELASVNKQTLIQLVKIGLYNIALKIYIYIQRIAKHIPVEALRTPFRRPNYTKYKY